MQTITTVAALTAAIQQAKQDHKTIGLVPTMGALHEGHLSLITKAREQNDLVVVSVFVNPIQFNNKEDLAKYPRTVEADCEKLAAAGADIAFVPSVEEMYPEPVETVYHFGPIEEVMEGPRRPGHFSGVAVVVRRLFDLTQPDRAYFGEKDFQQIAVVKAMVKYLHLGVEIVECPIIREENGLARSSRNSLLADDEKAIAPKIYEAMKASLDYAKSHTVKETHDYVVDTINVVEGLEVEYYSIVDGDTLLDVDDWKAASHVVGCITVYCGKKPIRLIDHIRYI